MKKHKGFTMIEMLVIVGCIAALVAIAYPKFSNMMEQNRENTDVVAMQSAQALLETAFDTGLLIDGKPVTDATADTPLYYDPSGKLTWQLPEGYGEGTDSPSGVTWSCCDDYEYNPAASYKGGIIYCYYVAPGAGVAYPGLHVHWSSDKDRPNNRPKPADPVPTITFPTVPAQSEEITEATGENTPDTSVEPSKGEDKPSGSGNFEDPIFERLGSHAYPTTSNGNLSGYPLHMGHVYKYTSVKDGIERFYISVTDDQDDTNYDPWRDDNYAGGNPDGWYAAKTITPNGTVLTRSGDENDNFRLYKDKIVEYGTIFRDDDGKYYIFKAGTTQTTFPEGDVGKWVEINLGCPDKCGANVNH